MWYGMRLLFPQKNITENMLELYVRQSRLSTAQRNSSNQFPRGERYGFDFDFHARGVPWNPATAVANYPAEIASKKYRFARRVAVGNETITSRKKVEADIRKKKKRKKKKKKRTRVFTTLLYPRRLSISKWPGYNVNKTLPPINFGRRRNNEPGGRKVEEPSCNLT